MTGLDPDQLLNSLDAGIAAARFRRSSQAGDRTKFRVAGILILVIGSLVAVGALQYMASEIASSHRSAPAGQSETGGAK